MTQTCMRHPASNARPAPRGPTRRRPGTWLLLAFLWPAVALADFDFYAVYDRVAEPRVLGLDVIDGSVMSAGGQRIMVWGRKANRLRLLELNGDGGGVHAPAIPEALKGVWEATGDADGSRVFVRDHWDMAIYKLEAGSLRKIFDAHEFKDIGACDQIQASADGQWVYFRAGRHSIWRIAHDGGQPQRILGETEILRDGGKAGNIGGFRLAAETGAIVLRMDGYWDTRGVFHRKHELFLWSNGSTRQLTNDEPELFKDHFAISADGRMVAYAASGRLNHIAVLDLPSPSPRILEDAAGINAMVLDRDGSHLFYYNQTRHGRLLRTETGAGVDLFPALNVGAIAIEAPWSLAISNNAQRVSFRNAAGVYVGYLDRRDIPGAPVIEAIGFEPALTGAPTEPVTLRARIRDPDGADDILRTHSHTMIDGRVQLDRRALPLVVPHPVNDRGDAPDATAGDGVFSALAQPGDQPARLAETWVRVAAMDRDQIVVVADASLRSVAGEPSAPGTVALSAGQQQTVDLLGWPDSFSVWRIEENGQAKRHEAWTWYDTELTYVFVDGTFRFVEPATPPLPGATPTHLRPTQVTLGVDPEAVRAAVSRGWWEPAVLLNLLDDTTGFTAEEVMLAFRDGRLVAAQTWSPAARPLPAGAP